MRTIAAALALLTHTSLLASSIAPMDLGALPRQATLVVTGHVTAVRDVRHPGFKERIATVRVASVLQGTHRARSLEVRLRAGLRFFDIWLETGDSGVFFLKPSDGGNFEAAYPASFALFQKGTVRKPSD